MIDALGIEGRGAADNAVHLVSFRQQQFGQIRAVLAGNAGDESFFHEERVFNNQLQRWSI